MTEEVYGGVFSLETELKEKKFKFQHVIETRYLGDLFGNSVEKPLEESSLKET